MNDQVIRRTTPTRRWKSWCGELQDLRRLISLIEQLAIQRKSEVLSSLAGDSEQRRWDERKQVLLVTLMDGVDSISGPAEDVLEELDRRTVDTVKISTDFPGINEKLSVTISKTERYTPFMADKGVKLEIESLSPAWAKQCLAQVSDEVDKSVPKWSFFRTARGLLVWMFLTYATTVGVAVLIEARHVTKGFSAAVFLTLVIACVTTGLTAGLLNWLFPPFELYGEGGSSSGSRRIGAVVVFIASIVAGILVNLVT